MDTTETEEKAETESDRDSYDVGALEELHIDTRRSLDQAIRTHTNLANKAIKLVQVNGLVLTILVTGATQVDVGPYINFKSVRSLVAMTGFGLLLLSSVFAVVAYIGQAMPIGVGKTEYRVMRKNKLNKVEYLLWANDNYQDWIVTVQQKASWKNLFVLISTFSFMLGVLGLVAGILIGLYQ